MSDYPNIKGKYWWAVLYPESMVDDWKEEIDSILQLPYSYTIHNKDKDGHKGDRKIHLHLIIAFNNTTTYKNAISIFQKLMPSCTYIEKIINIRFAYEYLIHNTKDCKKKGKYLYDIKERILGNNFDIGQFEQRSLEEKRADVKELRKYILKHRIENDIELERKLQRDKNIDDDLYSRFEDALLSYAGVINNAYKSCYFYNQKKGLIKGN